MIIGKKDKKFVEDLLNEVSTLQLIIASKDDEIAELKKSKSKPKTSSSTGTKRKKTV